MVNFFHKLFNPHCTHCRDEMREAKECHNCDVLTQLLEKERAYSKQLLDKITEPKVIEKIVERAPVNREPVRAMVPTWAVQQRLLEEEDRAKARALRNNPIKTVDDIEKEVGIG